MELQILPQDFTVCQIPTTKNIDFSHEFVFLFKTDDEISLVCETAHKPANATACEVGWRALKISGILDFGMVGVIAKIAGLLAEAGISIFVISTYNTDYVLVKAEKLADCVQVLEGAGYVLR